MAGRTQRAITIVLNLRVEARIPYRNLKRQENESLDVTEFCSLPNDSVALSCFKDGLRAISLGNKQLCPFKHSPLKVVYRVAYDVQTDTLLLVEETLKSAGNRKIYSLVSFHHRSNNWVVVQRLPLEIFYSSELGDLLTCHSRVLLGKLGADIIDVFVLSKDHSLTSEGPILLQKELFRFACTRLASDTLMAFNHKESVSLHRLLNLQLERLAQVDLTNPQWLLFRGDLLFVADMNKSTETHAIVSCIVKGGELTYKRQVLDSKDSIKISEWCLASNKIVAKEFKTQDLVIFAFEEGHCSQPQRPVLPRASSFWR